MSDLYEHALGYLNTGHHLLTLHGKRPNPRYHEQWSWDDSISGMPQTEDERAALEEAFTHPTTTGVAILIPKGVLVADIDTEEAAELYYGLAGEMPDTVAAQTTKGIHAWFLAPGADGSRWLGGRTLLFKGFGGYVAVEPSAHFTDDSCAEQDGTYRWISAPGTGIDWLPDAIDKALRANAEMAEARPPHEKAEPSFGVALDPIRLWPEWNLSGLEKAIIEAAEGNQNNVILWAALAAQEDGVPFEVAMKHLTDAAVRGNHPRRRATATIRGAYARRARG